MFLLLSTGILWYGYAKIITSGSASRQVFFKFPKSKMESAMKNLGLTAFSMLEWKSNRRTILLKVLDLCWYSLLRRTRNYNPDGAIFCVLGHRLLPSAHLQLFFPFTSLKLGAKIHVGPRCLHWKKDYLLQATVTAGVFKWMIMCLCMSAPHHQHRYFPSQNWFWNKDNGEMYPALVGTWWIKQVSAVPLTALWKNNQNQTHSFSRVKKAAWSRH